MASKSALPRLDDIQSAILVIEDATDGVSFDQYKANRQLQWCVERGIEIISEASRRVPEDLKAEHPDIPWSKVAAIGNVLRHEYMDVAADAVWAVVQDHLPPLRSAVEAMIETLEQKA